MKILIQYLLYLHIAAGMSALVVAPVAMLVKKGGKAHRRWGKVYFWSMTLVTVTAVIIALYRPIPFLLMIAVFSYYMIVNAYRVLYLQRWHQDQRPSTLDWVLLLIAAIFNGGLLIWAVWPLLNGQQQSVHYLGLVFGTLGVLLVIRNARNFFNRPKEKYHWLYTHIGGMLGGYIATVSAFSAVNFHFMPGLLRWLWPTILGVPMISIWVRYYKRKAKDAPKELAKALRRE